MQCTKKNGSFWKVLILSISSLGSGLQASGNAAGFLLDKFPPIEIHGFYEMRAGYRTQNDPHEKDISVMEARLQAELFIHSEWAEFKYKGDVWGDMLTEQGEYDMREAWIFLRPADFLDIKIGRQILTWGTGELVFLNDLFPKDWQSFFIGRDSEYLKAPSDAVKCSFFTGLANLDVVYTPQFDPDRYVTGEYLSYWNALLGRLAGRDAIVAAKERDRWFQDDEVAVRMYKNINNYELALYGYRGFWKRPAGQTASGTATFPELRVYGTSARGQVGAGIGNAELAYYQSVDDESGSNSLVDNSEMRYLIGYAWEIGKDFNAGLQYYVEQMLAYRNYKKKLTGGAARDRYRHVITLQLIKLLMNQNVELSLSAYYSPSDNDAYLRPKVHYKYTDHIALEAGADVFVGNHQHTFFAQFENNTNAYMAVRYSF